MFRIRGLRERMYARRDGGEEGRMEVGQDLQADLGAGEGLSERCGSIRLLEGKFITRELNQYGGC